MVLADLGADVLKIEPPEGDATRGWGPPWVGDAGRRDADRGLLPGGQPQQALPSPRPAQPTTGGPCCARALEDADVLIENFRPGGLARLGFDDETLRAIDPDLIHLAISGYGTVGPAADRPGYDFVIQAVGGLMSITGDADDEGGGPTKVGVAISDIVSGLFATIGILAALLARDGGRAAGQRVDVSLLASTLAILVNQAQNAFVTGRAPGRRGNAHPNIVPYETFATADGTVAVAVGSERQWPRLCDALGVPELAADPRFATNGDRVEAPGEPPAVARGAVRDALERRLAGRPRGGRGAERADHATCSPRSPPRRPRRSG